MLSTSQSLSDDDLIWSAQDKITCNVRQENVTHCDARAFRRPEDVVEDMEHLSKDRTVFESILHVIGGFKNILSKKKKVVALLLCAFPLHIVWRVASRLPPLTYVSLAALCAKSPTLCQHSY